MSWRRNSLYHLSLSYRPDVSCTMCTMYAFTSRLTQSANDARVVTNTFSQEQHKLC